MYSFTYVLLLLLFLIILHMYTEDIYKNVKYFLRVDFKYQNE